MAEQFGIKLSVSHVDLMGSINEAIDKINGGGALHRLKLGVDTSSMDSAIQKLKTEITDITGKIGTFKIDLGNSAGGGSKSVSGAAQSQDKELNKFVSEYMKQFDIVRKTAEFTAAEIKAKFTAAISGALNAKSIGNENGFAAAIKELTKLTEDFTRSFKDFSVVDNLEDYKARLNSIVPVSREVHKELESMWDGAGGVRKMMDKAFSRGGWDYTVDAGGKALVSSDVFLANLGIPGYDDVGHAADGIARLTEEFIRLRAAANEKINGFVANYFSEDDIKHAVNNFAELNAAGQSVAEVTEKLRNAGASVWGQGADANASRMMSSIGSCKGAVDALGQALDRLSANKSVDMSKAINGIDLCVRGFQSGALSAQELIKEFDAVSAAENKNAQSADAASEATKRLSAEIDKTAKKKSSGNGKVNLTVDGDKLRVSINDAIRGINGGDKFVAAVKIPADESFLKTSISKAISSVNKSGELDGKPVKIPVIFKNVQKAVKELQAQVNGNAVKIDTVRNSGVVENQVSESLKQEINSQNLAAQAAKDTAKATESAANTQVNSTDSVTEAINQAIERTKMLGDAMRETKTFAADGVTPVSKSVKSGTAVLNDTKRFRYNNKTGNFDPVSSTTEKNTSALKSNLDRMIDAAIRLDTKLKDVRASYADLNSAKPVKETEHIEALTRKYDEITRSIINMAQTSGENTTVLKANIEAEIADLERLAESYRNAEYAATSLRTKDIDTVKAEQLNKIEEFVAKITGSEVPLSKMSADIAGLSAGLEKVTDKNSLISWLNELSVAESKFKSLAAQVNASNSVMDELKKSLSALDKITNNPALYKNKGRNEITVLFNDVEKLRAKWQELLDSLKNDGSAENLAKVRDRMAGLQAETEKAAQKAKDFADELRNTGYDESNLQKIGRLQAKLEVLKINNSAGLGKLNPNTGNTFGQDIDALMAKLPEAKALGLDFTRSLSQEVGLLEQQMKAAGAVGKTFFQEMGEKASKFIKWTAMTLVITKARMYFRKLFTTVYELDTELIDLKKTFKGTAEELNDFYFEANKLAKQMGVTTAEIIKQGSAWSRLGYSSNETMKKMAEMSAMFAAISPDMGVEEAQNGLVSIMKAFGIDPDNALDKILSKVNIIGNTAATSNGEIVEMLEKSSSAMKEANNTLEETIAQETAAVEITRDASSVGNAFKTNNCLYVQKCA